jgi:hypothetical protein
MANCKKCGDSDFEGLSPLYSNGLCPCCNFKEDTKKNIKQQNKMTFIGKLKFIFR